MPLICVSAAPADAAGVGVGVGKGGGLDFCFRDVIICHLSDGRALTVPRRPPQQCHAFDISSDSHRTDALIFFPPPLLSTVHVMASERGQKVAVSCVRAKAGMGMRTVAAAAAAAACAYYNGRSMPNKHSPALLPLLFNLGHILCERDWAVPFPTRAEGICPTSGSGSGLI